MYGHFLEEGHREDLSKCRRGVQVEALLDDGDEDVDRDGNPICVFTAFSDVPDVVVAVDEFQMPCALAAGSDDQLPDSPGGCRSRWNAGPLRIVENDVDRMQRRDPRREMAPASGKSIVQLAIRDVDKTRNVAPASSPPPSGIDGDPRAMASPSTNDQPSGRRSHPSSTSYSSLCTPIVTDPPPSIRAVDTMLIYPLFYQTYRRKLV